MGSVAHLQTGKGYPGRRTTAATVPQHRLLTAKEWAWIGRGHRYGYWTVTGPRYDADGNECYAHHDLVHVLPDGSLVS